MPKYASLFLNMHFLNSAALFYLKFFSSSLDFAKNKLLFLLIFAYFDYQDKLSSAKIFNTFSIKFNFLGQLYIAILRYNHITLIVYFFLNLQMELKICPKEEKCKIMQSNFFFAFAWFSFFCDQKIFFYKAWVLEERILIYLNYCIFRLSRRDIFSKNLKTRLLETLIFF